MVVELSDLLTVTSWPSVDRWMTVPSLKGLLYTSTFGDVWWPPYGWSHWSTRMTSFFSRMTTPHTHDTWPQGQVRTCIWQGVCKAEIIELRHKNFLITQLQNFNYSYVIKLFLIFILSIYYIADILLVKLYLYLYLDVLSM